MLQLKSFHEARFYFDNGVFMELKPDLLVSSGAVNVYELSIVAKRPLFDELAIVSERILLIDVRDIASHSLAYILHGEFFHR